MNASPALVKRVKYIQRDPLRFSAMGAGIVLRPYQVEPILAIIDSIEHQRGMSFVVMISRQAGKNEMQAAIESYLLSRYRRRDVEMVMVSPTFKPQTQNAMRRLKLRLSSNLLTRNSWRKTDGYIYSVGDARIAFFSGDTRAKVVGATASLALFVDEAQDVDAAKFDKDFSPMAAANNATIVYFGTAWTSTTLLARAMREAKAAQERDGRRRVFVYDADDVRRLVASYGAYVDKEVARLGREHPLIKTQYFCETIDAQVGMFNATRMALIHTKREAHDEPRDGSSYAFLLDVAGQDEAVMNDPSATLANPGRDAVTLSIVELDMSSVAVQGKPTYTVVHRVEWFGLNHLVVFGKLRAYAENWQPTAWVMDATGVGEGLWAMLDNAFPALIEPVKFSAKVKSEIGWGFLSIIETGRFHDASGHAGARQQYAACVSEIRPGPAKLLSWSVPEGTRGADGLLIHDDHLLADALVARLDLREWSISFDSVVVGVIE